LSPGQADSVPSCTGPPIRKPSWQAPGEQGSVDPRTLTRPAPWTEMVRVTRCCPHPSNLACADSERDPLMSTDNVLGPSCWGVNVTARSHDSPGARARPRQVPPTAKLSRSPDEPMEIGEDAAPPTFETVMILIANIASAMPEKERGPATGSRAPPLAAPERATAATAGSEAR